MFDCGPWTSTTSEFITLEFGSLRDYWRLWNDLRELPAFREALIRVDRVSLGYERSIIAGLVDT